MIAYAHSLPDQPREHWEPLFTPDCAALPGGECKACERMDRPEFNVGAK